MAEGQIIVTGASRGIGSAIVAELRGRGMRAVSLSRSEQTDDGLSYICDMTVESQVRNVFTKIAERGPIAGLVNNAGVHILGSAASLSTDDFKQTMELNTTAVMIASREAYPYLRDAGGGVIVNIGSFFDKMGVPDNLAYCASKAAVAAMTRCLAVEWARDKIRAVNVAPGYIETDLNRDYLSREKVKEWMKRRIPVGAPGSSKDVARLVATLLDERFDFLTGETIYMDGGQGINH